MLERETLTEFLKELKTKYAADETLKHFEDASTLVIDFFENLNKFVSVSDAYTVNELLDARIGTLIYVENINSTLYKPLQDISNIVFEFISQYKPQLNLALKK